MKAQYVQASLVSDVFPMAVGDTYRVSATTRGVAGIHVNTFHVRELQVPGSSSLDLIHAAFDTIVTEYMALFPSTVALEDVSVARVAVGQVGLPVQHYPHSETGSRAPAEFLPFQSAVVATIKGVGGGKRGTGRMYFGYLFETDQANGLMGAGMADKYDAFLTALADAFDGGAGNLTHQLGIFSRVGNSFAPYVSHAVRNAVFTQRRRRLGHGA